MKNKLTISIVTIVALFAFPKINFGQAVAPNLDSVASFALFSTIGSVSSSSTPIQLTHITGNIGANSGPISGFGNVDGVLYAGGTKTANAALNVTDAEIYLRGLGADVILATPFGQGAVLTPGVYRVESASMLKGILTLDALNDPNAVFIFQLEGALDTEANTKVKLVNDAQACNVFWNVGGAVTLAAGTYMRGTIIAFNDFIDFGAGDTLEGRALTAGAGAITANLAVVRLPLGCGTPILEGPSIPVLNSVECYALFSSIGPVTDNGSASFVIGNVGTNSGLITQFDPLKVTGEIHEGDASTIQLEADLGDLYDSLVATPYDIQLMEPTLLGYNLVLTPHTYLLAGAVALTDTLFLNAQGNGDAVFIFKIDGAFDAAVNSRIVLMNGTQAKNVFWKIDGEVNIYTDAIFNGSIISAGAINLFSGVEMNGRALTIVGAVNTSAVTVNTPSGTVSPAGTATGPSTVCQGETGVVYSVSAINNATSYLWDLPAGTTITDGAGTATITVDFSTTATSGTFKVTVTGTSNCGPGTINQDFEVEVLQNTSMNPVSSQELCNEETTVAIVFSGGTTATTYSWVNGNTSIGLLASGNGDINSFTATNTGLNPEIANITVTPSGNGCDGSDELFSITVNATPTVDNVSDQTVCHGESTAIISFTGGTTSTTYSWVNGNTSIGLLASGNGDINSFTATNTGLNPEIANITVTPSENGCDGLDEMFSITVSPAPTMNNVSDQSLCNGEFTATINFTGGTTSTTYAWSNDNTSIGLLASGNGDINSFTATNTGLNAEIANITVTPSGNGCDGLDEIFSITVNPNPTVDNVSDQSLCNGELTATINFTGGTVGTTYSWTNDNTSIGLLANGNGNINVFTATNTGLNPEIANITVSPSGSGCGGSDEIFSITVSPTPTMNNVSDQTLCNDDSTATISFTGGTTSTTYSWVNGNTSIGLIASGNGAINSFIAINTGLNPKIANITVTPSENGCDGTDELFSITVNSIPTMDEVSSQILCPNESTSAIMFSGAPAGAVYNWSNNNTLIGLNESGNGDINSFVALNSTTESVVATIIVVPSDKGCEGLSTSFTIEVDDCYDFNIPEGFSPNGDGVNDLFVIRGINYYPDNSIMIFNRWGVKLFEASPYTNTWDGTSTAGISVGGDDLPVGTYFYILDLGNGSEIYKGTIYLNR